MEQVAQALDGQEARAVDVRDDGDVVVVNIDPEATFDVVRAQARRLFAAESMDVDMVAGVEDASPGLRGPYAGRLAHLEYGGRTIDLFDLRRLVHLLRDEFDIRVSALHCTPESLKTYAERELKVRVFPGEGVTARTQEMRDQEAAAFDAPEPATAMPGSGTTGDRFDLAGPGTVPEVQEITIPDDPERTEPISRTDLERVLEGRRVLVVDRTVRSGTAVCHPGDIIVYGDVNAGGHIEAGGNIVVLGSMRGLAHAGAQGDAGAFIIALDLRPTQVRIGECIAVPPAAVDEVGHKEQIARMATTGLAKLLGQPDEALSLINPEIAWVQDGLVRQAPYRGRLPC
jgi:septum site-determining protein MinC